MKGTTPLWKAHDVSQQLQDKIEVLPNVERAFVHVDHEWTHVPVRFFAFLAPPTSDSHIFRSIESYNRNDIMGKGFLTASTYSFEFMNLYMPNYDRTTMQASFL
jgi:hypothetical protein